MSQNPEVKQLSEGSAFYIRYNEPGLISTIPICFYRFNRPSLILKTMSLEDDKPTTFVQAYDSQGNDLFFCDPISGCYRKRRYVCLRTSTNGIPEIVLETYQNHIRQSVLEYQFDAFGRPVRRMRYNNEAYFCFHFSDKTQKPPPDDEISYYYDQIGRMRAIGGFLYRNGKKQRNFMDAIIFDHYTVRRGVDLVIQRDYIARNDGDKLYSRRVRSYVGGNISIYEHHYQDEGMYKKERKIKNQRPNSARYELTGGLPWPPIFEDADHLPKVIFTPETITEEDFARMVSTA